MQDTQEGYEEENPKSKSNWKQAAVIHVKAGSEPEGRRQNPQKTLQKVTQEEKYKENTRKLLFYMPYIYISSSFLWILVLNMPIYVAEFIRIIRSMTKKPGMFSLYLILYLSVYGFATRSDLSGTSWLNKGNNNNLGSVRRTA